MYYLQKITNVLSSEDNKKITNGLSSEDNNMLSSEDNKCAIFRR